MKKIFTFVLSLIVTIACLCACEMANNNSNETSSTTTETGEHEQNAKADPELYCDITKEEALRAAELHWGVQSGKVSSDNGYAYLVLITEEPTDTVPYYVAALLWFVENHHYSLIERIYIDAQSGECTVEFGTQSILDAYKRMLTHKHENDTVDGIERKDYPRITSRIFDTLKYIVYHQQPLNAGYSTDDINGDGVNELILIDDKHTVWAILTYVNGVPTVIDSFNNTNKSAYIGEDGTIYTYAYSKCESAFYSIATLTSDGKLLGLSYECVDFSHYFDNADPPKYYKTENGLREEITKEEYLELCEYYMPHFSTNETIGSLNIGFIFNAK